MTPLRRTLACAGFHRVQSVSPPVMTSTSESVAIAIKLRRVTTLAPDRPYSGLAGTLGLVAGEDVAAVAEDSRSRVAARAGSAHVTRSGARPEPAAHGLAAGALPTLSAPDRFMVGSTSVPMVRHVSLPATHPRAKLLLHSRRASGEGTCEVT